jgi:hypothetical protein
MILVDTLRTIQVALGHEGSIYTAEELKRLTGIEPYMTKRAVATLNALGADITSADIGTKGKPRIGYRLHRRADLEPFRRIQTIIMLPEA